MEFLKQSAPRCKSCRRPEEDDPRRMMVFMQDDLNNYRDVVHLHCPTLKCGQGWFIEAIFDVIDLKPPNK